MTAAILIQNILAVLIAWAMVAFDLYWFYTRHHKKIKPKYPMAPPDAEPVDAYFPRTNIPRPIHADAIKIHEKQRKLQQIKKMRKKKKQLAEPPTATVHRQHTNYTPNNIEAHAKQHTNARQTSENRRQTTARNPFSAQKTNRTPSPETQKNFSTLILIDKHLKQHQKHTRESQHF